MTSSLRFKLIAVLVLITSVSLSLVGAANFLLSKNKLIHQMEEQSISSVKNSAQNLYDFLSIRQAEVELISRVSVMKKGTMEEQLDFLKQELKTGANRYYSMGVSDLSGHMVFTSGSTLDISGDKRFQEALKGKTFISDPHLYKLSNKYIISITVPVFNDINLVTSIVDISLDADQTFRQHLHPPSEFNKTIIINKEGLMLYHTDPAQILMLNIYTKYPEFAPTFAEAISKDSGFIDETYEDQKVRLFYARIPDLDWYLSYSMPIAAFEAPTCLLLWWTVGILVVTELVLVFLIYWTTHTLVITRVRQILRVTEAVADGNFYMLPLKVKSKDELGSLAHSVNGMIENLRELFEPFDSFIHHNQYAMIVTDPSFKVNHFNARAEEMLGYTYEEVHKKATPTRWLDADQLKERAIQYSVELQEDVPADCTALVIKSLRHLKEDTEWIWHHKEGHRIYVQSNASLITHPDGSLKGYVFIARDISDIKESAETKERLLAIVESAHDAILTFDHEGNISYMNQVARHSIGVHELQIEHSHFSNFVDILSSSKLDEGLAIAAEQGFWEFEAEIITKQQRKIFSSLTIVPHCPAQGGDCYYSAIARDITDQVRSKEALIRAKQEADEANLAKGIFLARMSHEIRTPLNGIIGLSYLMERTSMTPLQYDYMSKITRSSLSLSEIINDILDFSKLDADRIAIEHIAFQLDETIDHVCETLSVLLGHKPIDFICEIDESVPLGIIGDPLRMYQVLLNLTSNAIKFTEQGTITLRVEMEYDGEKAGEESVRLVFSIIDTGIGMSEEQLAKLFQPFVQAEGSTSRNYGGTGLGLVIAKNLIENMGGHIQVWSATGLGSEFRVSIPFILSFLQPKMLPVLPLRTLVVEDHPKLIQVLVNMLQNICQEAAGVHSWKEARKTIDDTPLDVVLLDMEAPDMYGEEVWVDMLRHCNSKQIRTIVCTTLPGRDALEKLPEDAAPCAILVKPLSRGVLYQTLQEMTIKSVENTHKHPTTQYPVTVFKTLHRILLVEDNEINQTVARSLLESRDCIVHIAAHGLEALSLLKNESYDLILMDIHMPMLGGIETTKHIRQTPEGKHIPIIAVTADSTLEQRNACIEAGMNDTVTKPIIPEHLFEIVDRYVRENQVTSPLILDTKQALMRFGGKSSLYHQMLNKYREQYAACVDQLETWIRTKNYEEAVRFTHSLRGASSNLSANRVFETATALEEVLEEALKNTLETVSDSPDNLIATRLHKKLKAVGDALEEVFHTITKTGV
ncbi:response regulator [Paenibacillus sp. SYP-B3998]|uniref:Circadian input-output histidine kinase CikA n=1 Tax=Paenibacillus sp. SYP-B3998 TaxID=2678564 RepID=A0A6G4A3A5_9BACL|nr:response regulator [Paenibacillus sp. SYP-B3998]NEW08301.1 response regulator [Paenibacillus sp. SYP-B3998]